MSPGVRATRRTGVLVMAHGTPAAPDEIEAFYTRIRRGRPPTPEQLADLVGRYRAIGGTSPLAARTEAQVAGVAARLEAAAPGAFTVRYGAKHSVPSIEDAATDLVTTSPDRVVGIVLTPHRSSMGSEEYLDRAAAGLAEAAQAAGVTTPAFERVSSWYRAPGFAELMAERVSAALGRLPSPRGDQQRTVLFTAHSLPERVVAVGDPYPDEVAESARLVAEAAGLDGAGVTWRVAWQSAGRTPEPWIGPDLLTVLRSLRSEGTAAVVVCPIGFVADHLEVLYDVDIEARRVADEAGVVLARTTSLDDDPAFLDILASVVQTAAGVLTGGPAGG